jgi:hypothetical protein
VKLGFGPNRGQSDIGEEGMATYCRSSSALLSIFNDHLQNKERFIGVRIDDKEDVYPALQVPVPAAMSSRESFKLRLKLLRGVPPLA